MLSGSFDEVDGLGTLGDLTGLAAIDGLTTEGVTDLGGLETTGVVDTTLDETTLRSERTGRSERI